MKQSSNKDTALLVFSLSGAQEAVRKPLFGRKNKQAGSDFFNLLIKETAKIAEASGIDVFWINEQQQRGSDFASRFTHAFEDLYAKGYDNVLSIGNDCPELTIDRLKTAIDQLQQKKIVLGPAEDGGVYLIGLPKAQFDAETFSKLPWQQTDLYEQMVLEAKLQRESFYLLDALADIDCQKDALAFAERDPASALSLFIIAHLPQGKTAITTLEFAVYSKIFDAALPLRAPPFFPIAA